MAGSWRPDPSKRYAERFRDMDGKWTDIVRNADGVQRKDPWSLWVKDEQAESVDDDELTEAQAFGCGLALWLLGLPAVVVMAAAVELGRGFSGAEVGSLPTTIVGVGVGIIVLVTIALIVNQTSRGRKAPPT